MCGECQWSDGQKQIATIIQQCDCGNKFWIKTPLIHLSANTTDAHVIFRCTKCDALKAAKDFMQTMDRNGQ